MSAVKLPNVTEMVAQLVRAPSASSADRRLDTGNRLACGLFIRLDRLAAATRVITTLIGEFCVGGGPRAA